MTQDESKAADATDVMPEAWRPALAMPDDCALMWPHPMVPDVAARVFRQSNPDYARLVRSAEVFDFGSVPLDDLEASKLQYVVELFHGEFLDISYPCVMYRFSSTVTDGALVIDRMEAPYEDEADAADVIRHYRLSYFAKVPSGRGFMLVGMATAIFLHSHPNESGLLFFPSPFMREHGQQEYPFLKPGDEPHHRTINARLRWDIGYLFLRCTLLLATEGIPRHVEKAPAMLNEHRARKGKPRIPRVTHINFRQYLAALEAGPPGHHASPVPHVRRGHIRRLENGRRVWVRDCLVNASPDVAAIRRESYKVHPPEVSGG